jgi:hypothetical protein
MIRTESLIVGTLILLTMMSCNDSAESNARYLADTDCSGNTPTYYR